MAKTTVSLDTPLRDQLQKLAAFEPQGVPVLSLYLDLSADQHGRDSYESFCRKAFGEHANAFDSGSAELASVERDIERIKTYLASHLRPEANALAVFASSGAGEFFEAVQLDVPLGEHWLFVGEVPHIYPLVRLVDQYPRYAAVALDTRHARIFVCALGAVERREELSGEKTRRHSMGGWSQARYQRRIGNIHQQHIREVVDALDRIVLADGIQHVIVCGDEVVVAMLRNELPPHLADKIVDAMRLDRAAGEDEILAATLQALRLKDADSDRERVAQAVGAWQAGGLGVVGPEATLRALQMGQVEELLMSASPGSIKPVQALPEDAAPEPMAAESSAATAADARQLHLSDELVTRAQQCGSVVRMIEDPVLLRNHGGVAATLRFRI
jgi:peptide subunit release factor 1 (eRF1)